jgi:multiple sugar transport system permease protein
MSQVNSMSTAYQPAPGMVSWIMKNASTLFGKSFGYCLLTFIIFLPIFWVGTTAFKNSVDAYSLNVFFKPTLDNFIDIFSEPGSFFPLLKNSIIVASCTVLITIPLALLCAYGFSRFHILGEKTLLIWVLSTQFIPPVVIVIPFYTFFRSIRMLDSLTGLVIINLSFSLPFAIWLLKGFVDGLPRATEEAAVIDGCNLFQLLRHVVLPLSMPGIITAAVFTFIQSWNEFLFALILTNTKATTMTIGLIGAATGQEGVQWEILSAAGFVVMVPMFILAYSIREYFVQGLTMGSEK